MSNNWKEVCAKCKDGEIEPKVEIVGFDNTEQMMEYRKGGSK